MNQTKGRHGRGRHGGDRELGATHLGPAHHRRTPGAAASAGPLTSRTRSGGSGSPSVSTRAATPTCRRGPPRPAHQRADAGARSSAPTSILPVPLLNHSYRSYVFGRALGELEGIDVDTELLYAGALLHDTGLVNPTGEADFTLTSSRLARSCRRRGRALDRRHRHPADRHHDALHTRCHRRRRPGGLPALGRRRRRRRRVALLGAASGHAHRGGARASPRNGFKNVFTEAFRQEAARVPEGRARLLLRYGAFAAAIGSPRSPSNPRRPFRVPHDANVARHILTTLHPRRPDVPHLAPAHNAHTESHDPAHEPHPRRPWAVLALALAAQVLVVLDISVVNTAMPTIGRDLQLASSDLQWMVTAYLLLSGGGPAARRPIADLLPRRTRVHDRPDPVHHRLPVQRVRLLRR